MRARPVLQQADVDRETPCRSVRRGSAVCIQMAPNVVSPACGRCQPAPAPGRKGRRTVTGKPVPPPPTRTRPAMVDVVEGADAVISAAGCESAGCRRLHTARPWSRLRPGGVLDGLQERPIGRCRYRDVGAGTVGIMDLICRHLRRELVRQQADVLRCLISRNLSISETGGKSSRQKVAQLVGVTRTVPRCRSASLPTIRSRTNKRCTCSSVWAGRRDSSDPTQSVSLRHVMVVCHPVGAARAGSTTRGRSTFPGGSEAGLAG